MSIQNQAHPSVKVCCPGISGTGKTTLLEKLIRREKCKWRFVYDHKDGDFARRFGVRPCFDFGAVWEATQRGGLVIYDPSEEFPENPDAGFDVFCDFVWTVGRKLRGKKMLIADELDELVTVHSKPAALCKILDKGRTYQLDCYFISQAMNGIHNQVRKQITEIFAFMHGDKVGSDWLVDERGFDKNELENLKHGEWLYFNKNTGERARGGSAFVPKNAKRDLRGL